MEQNFNFEIVSPEKIIFSSEASMVKLPSYEGDMSILQNHIPYCIGYLLKINSI